MKQLKFFILVTILLTSSFMVNKEVSAKTFEKNVKATSTKLTKKEKTIIKKKTTKYINKKINAYDSDKALREKLLPTAKLKSNLLDSSCAVTLNCNMVEEYSNFNYTCSPSKAGIILASYINSYDIVALECTKKIKVFSKRKVRVICSIALRYEMPNCK